MDRNFFSALENRRYRASLGTDDTQEQANASRKAAKDSIIPKVNRVMADLREQLYTFFSEAVRPVLDREGELFSGIYTDLLPEWVGFTWNTTNEDEANINRLPIFGLGRNEWISASVKKAEEKIVRVIRGEMSAQLSDSDASTVTESTMITRILSQVTKSLRTLYRETSTLFEQFTIGIMNYAEQSVQSFMLEGAE